LLAAATARALTRLLVDAQASEVRLSLARTAKTLVDLGDAGAIEGREPDEAAIDAVRETVDSAFGPLRRVRCPGAIDGITPTWTIAAGPLGVDDASFA
jgi:hypothetical protein